MWKDILSIGVGPLARAVAKRVSKKDESTTGAALEAAAKELLDLRRDPPADVRHAAMRVILGQMPSTERSTMDIGSILPLAQTMLSAVTGGKSSELVASTGDEFAAAAAVAVEISEVLLACSDAVADGNVSWAEIQGILAEVADVKTALARIKGSAPEA